MTLKFQFDLILGGVMKKLCYLAMSIFVFGTAILCANSGRNNKLVRADISTGRFGPQILFEFESPLDYLGEESGDQIKLYFQGISVEDFRVSHVEEKLKKLHKIIKSVVIKSELVPVARVILTINFIKDAVFKFLLTKMDGPNYLLCNIFEKQEIEKVRRESTTLKVAHNDAISDEVGKKKAYTLLLMPDMVEETMERVTTV